MKETIFILYRITDHVLLMRGFFGSTSLVFHAKVMTNLEHLEMNYF